MFSDDVLRQYLANQAPPEVAARIEEALAADPALEDRLMALDDLAPVLRAGLDLLPDPQIDTRVLAAPPSRGWMRLAASFAAGAVLAGALAWGLRPDTPDWRMAVASYQALYAPATIAALEITPDKLQAQMARAESQIGASDLYDLTQGLEGLTPLRVQTLAYKDKPLIQIVFATDTGAPVALCVLASTKDRAPDAMLREGLASMSFATDDHHWLLIGTQDQGFVSDTGQELISRLQGQA